MAITSRLCAEHPSRYIRLSSMSSVREVLKLNAHHRPVDFVDLLVILGRCSDITNNAGSVLTAAVLKCDLSLFVYILSLGVWNVCSQGIIVEIGVNLVADNREIGHMPSRRVVRRSPFRDFTDFLYY